MIKLTSIQKKQPIQPDIKIHNLGRPSRTPLTTVPIAYNYPSHVKVLTGNPSLINPINPIIAASLNLSKNARIVKQCIGQPFQIRVPTNHMANLQQQVRELRVKCAQLQNKTQQNQRQNILTQIAKSTKQIQQQIQTVLAYKDTSIEQTHEGFLSYESNLKQQQNYDIQFEQAIKSLQLTVSKITFLETNNCDLSSRLAAANQQLQRVNKQNQQLKAQLRLQSSSK